jgi:hypothetical protein
LPEAWIAALSIVTTGLAVSVYTADVRTGHHVFSGLAFLIGIVIAVCAWTPA